MLTQLLLTMMVFLSILSGLSGCNETALAATQVQVLELPGQRTPSPPATTTPKISAQQQAAKASFLMGKAAAEKQFITIADKYASRKGMVMHPEAYEAFRRMHKAAQAEGIRLVIKSATRNFNYQRRIWNGKWTGRRKVEGKDLSKIIADRRQRALKILENSSMPGSSRHHWGTDIDLNAFNNDYFRRGQGKREYAWLQANAARFGFCQPYTPKGVGRDSGYHEERWHWTYMPLSRQYTREAALYLKDELFSDFEGADTAPEIGIVQNYVLGINQKCLE